MGMGVSCTTRVRACVCDQLTVRRFVEGFSGRVRSHCLPMPDFKLRQLREDHAGGMLFFPTLSLAYANHSLRFAIHASSIIIFEVPGAIDQKSIICDVE